MARARTRRRGKSSPWEGTLRLLVVLALLLAVNAYFFVYRRGTSLPDLQRMSATHDVLAIAATRRSAAVPRAGAPPSGGLAAGPASSASTASPGTTRPTARGPLPAARDDDSGRIEVGTIATGDTLSAVLRRAGVPAGTTSAVAAVLGASFDPSRLHAGHEYTVRFDAEERLRALELRVAPDLLFLVERGATRGAAFHVDRLTGTLDVKLGALGVTLDGSLDEALRRAGEGEALGAAFADALSAESSFTIEPHPGARAKLVVEKLFLGEHFWRYGRLLAVEFQGPAGILRGFLYSPAPGTSGYFTESGDALGASPLGSPLRQGHLIAGADPRRPRPVLRSEQAHLGADWPAPAGTPVIATADGEVAFRGVLPGDGECVVLAHPGGMQTRYAHLQRSARGLEDGQHVRRRQVIGYVGASGLPPGTAPRLRYEVRVGGHFVDPLHLRAVRDPSLPTAAGERFAATLAPLSRLLADTEIVVAPAPHPAARATAPTPAATPVTAPVAPRPGAKPAHSRAR
jgi:murein DD-endopeptidase MepM/ murein hydrolase activator NlpD